MWRSHYRFKGPKFSVLNSVFPFWLTIPLFVHYSHMFLIIHVITRSSIKLSQGNKKYLNVSCNTYKKTCLIKSFNCFKDIKKKMLNSFQTLEDGPLKKNFVN